MGNRLAAIVAMVLMLAILGCVGPAAGPAAPDEVEPATGTAALADAGRNVYGRACAGCHGAKGGGVPAPALVGSKATLGDFGHAQALLDYISQEMPGNRPGALAPEEYEQLLVFLLLENQIVESDMEIDLEALSSISLK